MYAYFVVFLILLFNALMERIYKSSKLWMISYLLLFFMAFFRYGQGTDYFGYYTNYINGDVHSEFGYIWFCKVLRHFNISFYGLVAIVTSFDFGCILRFLIKLCKRKAFSLCLFFPTVYLTYVCSALRQGIVICFFLGFLVEWYINDKKLLYVLGVILSATFHSAMLVLLLVFLIDKFSMKSMALYLCFASVFGCILYILPSSTLSFMNVGSFQRYLAAKSISVTGLCERIFMFCFFTTLFLKYKESDKTLFTNLYKLYTLGFSLSLFFLSWSTISSRIGAPFKSIEIFAIPNILYGMNNSCDKNTSKVEGKLSYYLSTAEILMILYFVVMYVKSIYMNISQGQYSCNIFSYPYFSVFNKEELFIYRHKVTYWEKVRLVDSGLRFWR